MLLLVKDSDRAIRCNLVLEFIYNNDCQYKNKDLGSYYMFLVLENTSASISFFRRMTLNGFYIKTHFRKDFLIHSISNPIDLIENSSLSRVTKEHIWENIDLFIPLED